MLAKIYSAAVYGVDAYEVEIEVNGAGGNPNIIIVGLPDAAVKESRDRVTTAISNSGYFWPRGRTTINLAPADIKKEGPSFDLPIALGMIAVSEELDSSTFEKFSFVGELALNGAVRPVKGVLPVALEARRRGKQAIFVPEANAHEAAMVEGIDVYAVQNLRQTFEFIRGETTMQPTRGDLTSFFASHQRYEVDFSDVKGQGHVKRAIEVAVAGGHNWLMIGPPGSGKSMLSKRIPTIIPPMSLEEAIESTKIHSISGMLSGEQAFVSTRPFRSPHHTISDVGLLGGSTIPTPGEVSLAHHGVLFLDELAGVQTLHARSDAAAARRRQGYDLARGRQRYVPFGVHARGGDEPMPVRIFRRFETRMPMRAASGQRYRQRISGTVARSHRSPHRSSRGGIPRYREHRAEEGSAAIRDRVGRARERQQARFRSDKKVNCNARMGPRQIKQHCKLSDESQELIRVAMTELNLSARAYDRILKVSRTVADLQASDEITTEHVSEAIQYRTFDRTLWV